jgi:macrodomain Ter protein organizer (MatP/YcbG family)
MKARSSAARAQPSTSAAKKYREISETARRQTSTRKVSVSIEEGALEWLKEEAQREKATLSSKMTEAIENLRRDQARDRVIAYLGDAATLTDEDRARIEAEWA